MSRELFLKWLYNPTVLKIVGALVGVLVIQLLIRLVIRSVLSHLKNTAARYRARKFVSLMGYLTMFVLITVIFSDRLGGLTVAFGFAGAGIAFALQEVITSIAGWFAISFGGFFKVGDWVQLGGIKGDVIDIGVLRSTIMEIGEWIKGDLYTGRIVLVANSFVFKEPVFNYSGDFPFLWDEIIVPVRYGSDATLARTILQDIAREALSDFAQGARASWKMVVDKYLIEEATVDPTVTLVANDNWLEFTVRYVVDFKSRRGTKDRLFTRIVDEFAQTVGRVDFASQTFHLVQAPPIDVRVKATEGEKVA